MTEDPTLIMTEAIAEPPAPFSPTLCLRLHPDDLPLLLRRPELKPGRSRTRPSGCSRIWHDTPDLTLASARLALALCHEAGSPPTWTLSRLVADKTDIWPPGAPAPLLGTAADPAELDHPLLSPPRPCCCRWPRSKAPPAC